MTHIIRTLKAPLAVPGIPAEQPSDVPAEVSRGRRPLFVAFSRAAADFVLFWFFFNYFAVGSRTATISRRKQLRQPQKFVDVKIELSTVWFRQY